MKKERKIEVMLPVDPVMGQRPMIFDPLGSYTGITADILDVPVQDADDL